MNITEGLLDILNEYHLIALHHVFMPRINQSLTSFLNAYNHHPLSTEGNQTPMQLYHSGLLDSVHLDNTAAHSILNGNPWHYYGIDENGPFPQEPTCNNVEVPDMMGVNPVLADALQQVPNPLQDDGEYGCRHYGTIINYLNNGEVNL